MSLFSFVMFQSFHTFLETYMSRPLANNFTAMLHACGTTILTARYLSGHRNIYNIVRAYSTGYFIYDFFHVLKYGKRSATNAFYLYHHLVSIYIIHKNPVIYKGCDILFWGELSNLPSYLVYYFLKTNNPQQLKIWKRIQAIVYTFIRLPVMAKLGYTIVPTVKDKTPFAALVPVYLMGAYWSSHLWRKLRDI